MGQTLTIIFIKKIAKALKEASALLGVALRLAEILLQEEQILNYRQYRIMVFEECLQAKD